MRSLQGLNLHVGVAMIALPHFQQILHARHQIKNLKTILSRIHLRAIHLTNHGFTLLQSFFHFLQVSRFTLIANFTIDAQFKSIERTCELMREPGRQSTQGTQAVHLFSKDLHLQKAFLLLMQIAAK
ncbi:hypothetical protein D3C87_1450920 [compost metagenome]